MGHGPWVQSTGAPLRARRVGLPKQWAAAAWLRFAPQHMGQPDLLRPTLTGERVVLT